MLNLTNVLSIDEIKDVFSKDNPETDLTIFDLLKRFNLGKILLQSGFVKKRGYSITEVISIMLLFPVLMVSTVRGYMHSIYALTNAKKDVFFRLMNNENLNWRNLMYAVAKVFRKSAKTQDHLLSPICGIIDDTMISKTGIRIERIGKVFDHISKTY